MAKEHFEDTKGIIRSRKSDKQTQFQKENGRTSN